MKDLKIKNCSVSMTKLDANEIKKQIDEKIPQTDENDKKHKCDQCGNGYGSLGNLRRHVKEAHDGIKAFSCDYCDEAFFRSVHLSNHVKRPILFEIK